MIRHAWHFYYALVLVVKVEGSNTPEAAQIVIQVQDDVPTIDGVDALAVDEDDLSSTSNAIDTL